MSDIRLKAVKGIEAGDVFSVSRRFTIKDVDGFADISRDYNPVHFDKRFAKVKNFSGLICHGLLVASLVTEIGGQIGWLASGMSFNFKKPVYCGDTVTCVLKITEVGKRGRARAEAVFTNDSAAIVMDGVLSGIVPGFEEKQVLRSMMSEGDPTNKILRKIREQGANVKLSGDTL